MQLAYTVDKDGNTLFLVPAQVVYDYSKNTMVLNKLKSFNTVDEAIDIAEQLVAEELEAVKETNESA